MAGLLAPVHRMECDVPALPVDANGLGVTGGAGAICSGPICNGPAQSWGRAAGRLASVDSKT